MCKIFTRDLARIIHEITSEEQAAPVAANVPVP